MEKARIEYFELLKMMEEKGLKQCVACGYWIRQNLGQCNYCCIKFYGYPC